MITIANANALHIPLPDQSVQCVITSPPYYGLRDYGTAKWEGGSAECDHLSPGTKTGSATTLRNDGREHTGPYENERALTVGYPYRDTCSRCGARRVDAQIGLESTPAAYVAHIVSVMRECWRVLKDDGTLWLNLGDSYASQGGERTYGSYDGETGRGDAVGKRINGNGLKPKDLCGIPWMIARELQQPFYTGHISEEKDRVWLAAIIDAEGTICGFTHQRKDDGNIRTGVHVAITNSNQKLLYEAHRIWPASLSDHGRPGDGHLGKMETWRWIAHNVDDKSILMREMYPYLISKKKQALLAYNLFEISKDAKRLGKSSEAKATHEKRALIVSLISKLNHLEDVDIPGWCVEPPSLYEQGWYLRQDIIWHKPNPMPESVTDRCTKAHEYIFLLTKRARYYYDAEAIKEPYTESSINRFEYDFNGYDTKGDPTGQILGRATDPHGGLKNSKGKDTSGGRNRRSVWTVATQPYSGSHFAVFPMALIEPMILAGSRRGDVVLDPFAGSGTTGAVAVKHGRRAVLLDLNTKYIDLQFERTNGVQITMPLETIAPNSPA